MDQARSRLYRMVAEFLTIVLGVLVALGVDNWNVDRHEVALGRDCLDRTAADIIADRAQGEPSVEAQPRAMPRIAP